ncbi:hypothetical protein D0T12_07970 [Actinomadura spongiicola]|uniref:Uncharacterized protein n=1 Tax=Actinomadura spongiicola TaxID=2303421 RepID=A0A372GM98_9ACTN|nr:hypothetical protein [Actinomadura spongiicola]RFS86504.1 hypothetical protein D0T12_07970 [Actinomadura spongiicola]
MTTIDEVNVVGDGTQNTFGNTVSRDLIVNQLSFVRGRPSMVLSEGEIDDRVAEYVRARNHAVIVDVLARHHAIALVGPPGAGVATTAIAALRELRSGMPIRLFSTGEDDVEGIPGAERGYLVRAGDEDETRLRACLEAVRASGGFLLVVGTEGEQEPFAGFLPVVAVEPPPAEAVYRRRLERRGFGRTGWPGWPRAGELLKGALPGEARRLADLVAAAGDEIEVERAYLGWKDQVSGWFADHPGLRDQTLLVAAATIAPADETSVYGAALSLARQLKINVEGGGLAWCPSTGLSELLGADRADEGIVFRRHGYAESVLRYVWDDYPLARMDLLSWLSALPTDEVVALGPGLRQKLVEVFADLAAEHGAAEKIVQMAEAWAGDRHRSADLAYVALARTCLHPLIGGRVRKRLYDWSRWRQAPQTLKLTVARVCQVLGETHVTIALTRLKHLATHGNEQLLDEVLDVARTLAAAHPRAVVYAAMEWCRTSVDLASNQDGARRAYAGLRLLLDLAPAGWTDAVLKVIGHLACHRGERMRRVASDAALELAARHRGAVFGAVMAWVVNADERPYEEAASRKEWGTTLFLRLAAERDAAGLAVTLTGPDAVAPMACTPAWTAAMAAETGPAAGYEGFAAALGLWLDTAVARPDLRPWIVSTFEAAAGGDPVRCAFVVGFVRGWAGTRRSCRDVRDDVLVRLLHPTWQRLALAGWVWLRRKFEAMLGS